MSKKEGFFRPPRINLIESGWQLSILGKYPYKEDLRRIKKMPREKKVAELANLLGNHDPNSLIHSFEDALLAVKFVEKDFLGIVHNLDFSRDSYRDIIFPRIKILFEGVLLHDIGKTGVEKLLLNIGDKESLKSKFRHRIHLHGALGGVILQSVGLGDLAYFCYEHNIASGKKETWNYDELNSRHGLTEIVSLADLVAGLLDPRRFYRKPATKEWLLDVLTKKEKQGVYSPKLMERFWELVNEDFFPPFTLGDYKKSPLFMTLLKIYGLEQVFEKSIKHDERANS